MIDLIFGSLDVRGNAVVTHRDSYLLQNLSVVSVRRPMLPASLMIGGGLIGFTIAFGDLLYVREIATILGASAASLVVGTMLGQLKLLSRDLRGSELSGVVWGHAATLNTIRAQIVERLAFAKEFPATEERQ
ncbi:MAG: hypothetical protein H6882_11705 [Rhodobiaceae bacterium]|nr:hypothetical protein [Nitratireductor sp.]MCC0049794.1 hypothetical protein [Rhodobiaceae bacterium]